METELLAAVGAREALNDVLSHDLCCCAWCPTCLRLHGRYIRSADCGMASLMLLVPSQVAISVLALSGIVTQIEASPRDPGQPYRSHTMGLAQVSGSELADAVVGETGSCAYPRAILFVRIDAVSLVLSEGRDVPGPYCHICKDPRGHFVTVGSSDRVSTSEATNALG